MRNIININEGWKFIRSDAGLPAAYPVDWTDVDLPQTDDGNEGAANWFTAMGSVELDDGPMVFPAGKMSIKTPIGEIYKSEAAWEFFSKMTGGKLGPDMPMWGMMSNFNLETMMTMMGNAPESALKALNKQLIVFDLVD